MPSSTSGRHIHHHNVLAKGMACTRCRERRVRCNGELPCAACKRSATHRKNVDISCCTYRNVKGAASRSQDARAEADSHMQKTDAWVYAQELQAILQQLSQTQDYLQRPGLSTACPSSEAPRPLPPSPPTSSIDSDLPTLSSMFAKVLPPLPSSIQSSSPCAFGLWETPSTHELLAIPGMIFEAGAHPFDVGMRRPLRHTRAVTSVPSSMDDCAAAFGSPPPAPPYLDSVNDVETDISVGDAENWYDHL